ncbi:MAG: response regulator [Thiotrichales bacterium]
MPQRILIVDSSKLVRRILEQRLDAPGRMVATAGSSNQALAKLMRDNYDLISTALDLPDETGFAFVRAVRALPGYARTSIIVVTGNTLEARAPIAQLGISAVIGKGGGIDALTAALRRRCDLALRPRSLAT